jgi:hypothetical protein
MPTLLLSARHTDDSQKLWRACIAANWDVQRVNGWQVPDVSAASVAIYGEPLIAHYIAQKLNLKLIEPPVDWLPKIPQRWRGRDIRLASLAEARELQRRAFIKPAEDKCFEARIYESGNELPTPPVLPADLPVLVQEVVHWRVEYRCFVVDRKIAAASAYWRHGALSQDPDGSWAEVQDELDEAKEFCLRFLADPEVSVPPAAVIDVGVIENHGWAVVECNAAWGAGIYGCDPLEVLRVLQRACEAKK